jgi:hypothetical protein
MQPERAYEKPRDLLLFLTQVVPRVLDARGAHLTLAMLALLAHGKQAERNSAWNSQSSDGTSLPQRNDDTGKDQAAHRFSFVTRETR